MNLFDRLPEEDKYQFWRYLDSYSDGDALPKDRLDYFLRFWNENKEPFFRAFGEQFILKQEIRFTKPDDELEDDMYSALQCGNSIVRDFIYGYTDKVRSIANDLGDYNIRYCLETFVHNSSTLVKNVYTGDSFTIPGAYTVDGKPLVVNHNCKAVKMLGKIVAAIDADITSWRCPECGRYHSTSDADCCGVTLKCETGYEMFRQAHSQVLNQKAIKGNLCLSIHPLDYITMSDNDCGWTSCMSWMEEYGDYRLGTIEMMNSPYVIVAYIESSNDMYVCGKDWNNKRWRQLYIVTDTVILGNRQYPYHSDDIQGYAIKWIKDLVQKVPGFGPYPEETMQLSNANWNTIRDKRVYFNFHCDYMYNDVYDHRLAYVAWQKLDHEECYDCNFSGNAVCTGCGKIIEYDDVDASRVQCNGCDGHWKCDFCGDWHNSYEESYCVDEYVVCEYCYSNETESCDCCEEVHVEGRMNHVYIQFVDSTCDDIKSGFNYNYQITLCDRCMQNPKEYEPLYGKMYDITDCWGNPRKAFDVRNITEDGLCSGSLSWSARKLLKSLQDAESDKDRLKLIEEIAY